jgi:peptidoglycan/LPS O-acetylase OafA/YrhL
MRSGSPSPASAQSEWPIPAAAGRVLALAFLTLFGASAIHFGLTVPLGVVNIRDPFLGAAVPEAILGVALASGGPAVVGRRHGRAIALGSTPFTLLVVRYALSITLHSGRDGDAAYHLTLVLALLIAIGLVLPSTRRRSE